MGTIYKAPGGMVQLYGEAGGVLIPLNKAAAAAGNLKPGQKTELEIEEIEGVEENLYRLSVTWTIPSVAWEMPNVSQERQ